MKKILQIIPATDWEAEFSDFDGEQAGNSPLACFALVEDDGYTYVDGMIATDGSVIDSCEDISNFKGYVKRNRKDGDLDGRTYISLR